MHNTKCKNCEEITDVMHECNCGETYCDSCFQAAQDNLLQDFIIAKCGCGKLYCEYCRNETCDRCEHHCLEQELCPSCMCVVKECDSTLCAECIYCDVTSQYSTIIYCETCNKLIYHDDEQHHGHQINKNSEKLEEYLFDKYPKIKEMYNF
jgi:hypothetical protein